MTSAELLVDAIGRIRESVHATVEGLTEEQLAYRVDADANSIAWLAWHLTRVQDDHVAGVADTDQVWIAQGWVDRFKLPFPPEAHGYGQSSKQVGQVKVGADLLLGYLDAVTEQTVSYLESLTDEDLPRIVDENWDPPVTLGVRLISLINDGMEHAGQAAFVRGIVERRG